MPWPLDGLAYVIMFMGPLVGGVDSGLIVAGGRGLLVGLAVGGLLLAANAIAFDSFVERALARLQRPCQRLSVRILTNILGFAWAIALCAAAVAITAMLVGRPGQPL